MTKRSFYLIHILILSVIVWGYYYVIGPSTLTGGLLFNYKDWFFPVLGALVILYILIFPSLRKFILDEFAIENILRLRNIMLIVIFCVFLYVVKDFLLLIDPFASGSVQTRIKFNLNYDYSLVVMIAMVTIGPLWEEIYFRGLLIGGLSKIVPSWLSIIISLLLFMSLHLSYPLFSLVFGGGYIFLYRYSKSLMVPLMAHITWNLIIVVINLL